MSARSGRRRIIAHHLILTGYGHWLPNDPRGSLSREFRNAKLEELGPIHFGRKTRQPTGREIRAFYAEAAEVLKHSVLWFRAPARVVIGEAIGRTVRDRGLTCYACCVLSDHAHVLIRVHRLKAQEMIPLLADASREGLLSHGLVRDGHPVWSCDAYVKYKKTPEQVRAAIGYIEGNCAKHHIAAQAWDFVVPYDNWPHHKSGK